MSNQRAVHFDGSSASGASHYPFSSAREHSDACRQASKRWKRRSIVNPQSTGFTSSNVQAPPPSYSESEALGYSTSAVSVSANASANGVLEQAASSLFQEASRLSEHRRTYHTTVTTELTPAERGEALVKATAATRRQPYSGFSAASAASSASGINKFDRGLHGRGQVLGGRY
ncbi:hypothetical protein IAT40_001508 [Kwoniella sp. CBS 6097]